MNFLEQVFWYIYVCISIGNILGVELWVMWYVFLADNIKLFFKMVKPFTVPATMQPHCL